ncbi:hypothetical protein DBR32_10190 [Taibaiella sp. KBW10]|uniref:hypothetical protein n=1 Tax=Taibaiella sp. KBW10 TaxID=2153357 RepID=UPI000F5A6787|nr:hypothetical protein [Taibaiella sp. KBW10]RQO31065.1 hypothetical protein DBR32_10190 [Taibaiella sp. KBW10]
MKTTITIYTALCGILLAGCGLKAVAQVKVGSNPTQIVTGARFQVDGDNTTTTPAKLLIDATGNVGIGTAAPTAKLQVSATGTNDPVRIENLQNAATTAGTTAKTLVVDGNGVLKTKNKDNVSAVRATGTITLAQNNTVYFTDVTAAATETFDGLNEFSGHTFTAAQDGLYQVSFTVRFDQTVSAFVGVLGLNLYNVSATPNYTSSYTANIQVPPVLSGPLALSLVSSNLVKLNAGQVIQFCIQDYAAVPNQTANYIINVHRVD